MEKRNPIGVYYPYRQKGLFIPVWFYSARCHLLPMLDAWKHQIEIELYDSTVWINVDEQEIVYLTP